MADNKERYNEVDHLLNGLFQSEMDLVERFTQRTIDLKLSQRGALAELGMELRTLKGMLNGTQKNVDLLALSRLADFLQVPFEKVAVLLLEKLEKNFNQTLSRIDNQEFIREKFDLVKLKKCGFIDSISDYPHIEERIVTYFGLKKIQDYGKDFINVAYSDGKPKATNSLIRDFLIESAVNKLTYLSNRYEYNSSKLIEYVPSIRWQSLNVKKGLFQVIRELFKLGVTVIYEPYITTLYARGATFAINDKPCIVLTDYTNNYPSLWFALIHEIFHVLFDWEKLSATPLHVSEELDRYAKREVEADNFAREFLFSSKKLEIISKEIGNHTFVAEYAKANQVHESVIYMDYCWDNKASERNIFGRFLEHIPKATEALEAIDSNSINEKPWSNRMTAKDYAIKLKKGVFDGL